MSTTTHQLVIVSKIPARHYESETELSGFLRGAIRFLDSCQMNKSQEKNKPLRAIITGSEEHLLAVAERIKTRYNASHISLELWKNDRKEGQRKANVTRTNLFL